MMQMPDYARELEYKLECRSQVIKQSQMSFDLQGHIERRTLCSFSSVPIESQSPG